MIESLHLAKTKGVNLPGGMSTSLSLRYQAPENQ
jgi:hypothetical protein